MSDHASPQEILAAAVAVRDGATAHDPWLSELRLVGIGWATVELERAAAEIAAAFIQAGLADPDWVPAERDALLGATAWVASGHDGRPAIVLLEPDTEGRLAATMARFGEGVAAVYLQPTGDRAIDSVRLGRAGAGPLGQSRLVLFGPTWGPHVLVADRASS